MRGAVRRGARRHDILHPSREPGGVPVVARPESGQRLDRVGEHRMTVAAAEVGEGEGRLGRPLDWVTTTNHKTIGKLYIGASLIFFLAGGIMAELMRTELATP